MIVSLGITGRCINIDLDDWLNMTDAQLQDLNAGESGYIISHPFIESAMIDLKSQDIDPDDELFEDEDLDNLFEQGTADN